MLFALLPFPLFQAGLSASAVWSASSLVFLLFLLAGIVGAVGASNRVARAGHPVRTPRVNAVAISVAGVSAIALTANSTVFSQPWIYTSVLILLLSLSFLYLATFIFNIQSQRAE